MGCTPEIPASYSLSHNLSMSMFLSFPSFFQASWEGRLRLVLKEFHGGLVNGIRRFSSFLHDATIMGLKIVYLSFYKY